MDDDNENEIEYKTELEDKPIKAETYKKDEKLDFTEKIQKIKGNNGEEKEKKIVYKLVDISKLETESYKKVYGEIKILKLDNNKISSLTLKGYDKLEILSAPNNHISQVNLCLPALRELNLSRNFIKKMFELINLPNLRKLILSQNSIKIISFDSFKSVKKTLSVLDLSENLIEFNEVKEFFNFCENFGPYMKELVTLSLTGNPFTLKKKYKDIYQSYIVYSFPKLQILNGRLTNNIIKKSNDKNPNYLPQLKSLRERMMDLETRENIKSYKDSNLSYKRNEQVSLKLINEELLKINQLGTLNDKAFGKLDDMIDIYINNLNIVSDDSPEDQELDDFEIFLDYIEKIIDGVSGYEKRLYAAIGSFATIKYGKFASRALSCLKQRITNQNANDLIEVITNIYTFLKQTKEENIPCSVIDSLQVFIDEPQLMNIMKVILKRIMDIGLKIGYNINYKAELGYQDKKKNNNNIDMIYLNLFNSVIAFVTKCISLENESFLNDYISNSEFVALCNMNLKEILAEKDEDIVNSENELNILKNLLEIIKIICILQTTQKNNELIEKEKKEKLNKQNEDNLLITPTPNNENEESNLKARNSKINNKKKKTKGIFDIFNQSVNKGGIRDRIEQKLNTLLPTVFTNSNQKESEVMSQRQKIYNMKTECKSLMQCYGAFLGLSEDVIKFLDNNSLLMKIIQILGQNEIICPIIISGACDCVNYTIDNRKINQSANDFSKISGKFYNFRYLLPLLFKETPEFNKICQIADQYGERTLERGKPIDFRYMDSKIINELYISLINLMSFLGENSRNNSQIGYICKDIASEMNKLNRDDGIANALILPNEDVKLSAVKCYYAVNVEELEPEEISSIYRQLGYISSIAGKFQTIIAIIFLILNKWFLYHLKNRNFNNIETCKEAIFMGMNLLSKVDLQKNAIEKENENRILMTAVLIVFLINVSNFENTKKFFSDPQNAPQMNKLLISEEESINHNLKIGVPLEIEKCHCGWVITNLLNLIKNGAINPYNYISLRLLIHLGDILENKKYELYKLNYNQDCISIMKEIRDKMIDRECIRIKDLSNNWRQNEEYYKKIKYDYAISSGKDLENEQKTFIKNFHVILEFILGQCSQKQISQFSRVMDNLFCKDIDKIIYSINHYPYFDEKYEKRVISDQDDSKSENSDNEELFHNFNNKDSDDENNLIDDENESIYEKFKKYLRKEDYNIVNKNDFSNLNYIKNELMIYNTYGVNNNLNRDKKEETPNNPYLRSLFISAFFRCIYAVLEHPYEKSIKNEMVKILYEKENITKLCQLAECSNFKENNNGTKILIIMEHILKNSIEYYNRYNDIDKSKRNDEIDNKLLVKIGKISYIIRKIVRVYKKEFDIENDDHILLLSQICKCSELIISLLQTLSFVSESIREATIRTMIDYEIIQIFIETIKEYMNKPIHLNNENVNQQTAFKNKLLNEMIEISSSIVGEYMSRCPSRKYDILEAFTRSFIFERCNMRKSFIMEIIDVSKISTLKVNISNILNEKYLFYVTPCLITNCTAKITQCRLLYITNKFIEFIEISDFDQMYNLAEFTKDEGMKIIIDDIQKILQFDYLNRIIIQTYDNEYIFFFNKIKVGKNIIDILYSLNNNIIIYQNVQIFTPMNPKNMPIKVKNNDDLPLLEDEIKDKSGNTILNCGYEFKGFCCDIFPSLFNKSDILQDAKVIVIGDGQLKIYLENFKLWDTLNAKFLFDQLEKNEQRIMSFENYFEEIAETWNLTDFSAMKLIDGDIVDIYNNENKPVLRFKIYDDLSYIKMREALNVAEIFEKFEND